MHQHAQVTLRHFEARAQRGALFVVEKQGLKDLPIRLRQVCQDPPHHVADLTGLGQRLRAALRRHRFVLDIIHRQETLLAPHHLHGDVGAHRLNKRAEPLRMTNAAARAHCGQYPRKRLLGRFLNQLR